MGFSKNYLNGWDYLISSIYQNHVVHHDALGNSGKVSASMGDIGLGYQWSLGFRTKIFARMIMATKNFLPISEDYYKMGYSGIIKYRANLEQMRAGMEFSLTPRQDLKIEFLNNRELSADGFVRHLSVTSDGEPVGTEIDFIHKWQIHSQWSLYNALWQFQPSNVNIGSDSAYGWLSRLEFAL